MWTVHGLSDEHDEDFRGESYCLIYTLRRRQLADHHGRAQTRRKKSGRLGVTCGRRHVIPAQLPHSSDNTGTERRD